MTVADDLALIAARYFGPDDTPADVVAAILARLADEGMVVLGPDGEPVRVDRSIYEEGFAHGKNEARIEAETRAIQNLAREGCIILGPDGEPLRVVEIGGGVMSDTPCLGSAAYDWRVSQGYSTDPGWMGFKTAEEFGETARAIIAQYEGREGRGDPVREAAQTAICLAALLWRVSEVDLLAAVVAEMDRTDSGPFAFPATSWDAAAEVER